MFIKVLSASLIAFFSMAGFSGRADAFPGEPFEQYRLKFGTPSNASPSAFRKAPENVDQFYWMEAEADPLLTGKKLKGNLVVLFKKSPVKEPENQRPESLNLISTREIYLVRVSAEAFDSLLESFSEKWKIVSKRGHIHSQRPYDLYQLVSADRRFNAEMSYSPLEAIVPLPSGSFKTTTPVFNLWIYITQTH